MMRRLIISAAGAMLTAVHVALGCAAAPAQAQVLDGLSVSPPSFSPARHEQATISFRSRRDGQAIVRLLGPDWQQVRELNVERIGANQVVNVGWDGRDDDGRFVPPESYLPLVEFADGDGTVVWLDPTRGVEVGPVLLEDLRYDAANSALRYSLAAPARVTVHAGINDGGPLLRTLLGDLPRLAGEHAEPWDGMDDTGAVDVAAQPRLRLFADGVSTRQPAVIVESSESSLDYSTYRRATESRYLHPTQTLRERGGTPAALPRPHDITPEPRFVVSVDGEPGADGLPVVAGNVRVSVALDDAVRIPVIERRFEIILFVDLKFHTEVEQGRSPAVVRWNSTQVPNGEHLLSVNVATLPGQMSAASLRVRVANPL